MKTINPLSLVLQLALPLALLAPTALRAAAPEFPDGQTVEFREGAQLPFAVSFTGDLVRTVDTKPATLSVARTFWVKREGANVLLSFDGTHFRPAAELIRFAMSIGATSDDDGGEVTNVQLRLDANTKP